MSVDSRQPQALSADSRAQESRALLSDSVPEHARFCAVRRMLIATLREWLETRPEVANVLIEIDGTANMLRQVANSAYVNANSLAQNVDSALETACPGQLELRQGTSQTVSCEDNDG